MDNHDQTHLPPLPKLIPQIAFDVYGLRAPFLGLLLRGLNYGVEEGKGDIIGLTLCYAQQFRGSPQVLVVESSQIPAIISSREPSAKIEWSLANLLSVRETALQIHSEEPQEWQDESVLERLYQEGMAELGRLRWGLLAPQSQEAPLAEMQAARDENAVILGRRFEEDTMLLVGAVGLQPAQFLEAVKHLVPLQQVPEVVQRHQEEFEYLTEEG